jgi:hypothetical protein
MALIFAPGVTPSTAHPRLLSMTLSGSGNGVNLFRGLRRVRLTPVYYLRPFEGREMELISSGGYAEYGSPPSIIYDPFRVGKGPPRRQRPPASAASSLNFCLSSNQSHLNNQIIDEIEKRRLSAWYPTSEKSEVNKKTFLLRRQVLS